MDAERVAMKGMTCAAMTAILLGSGVVHAQGSPQVTAEALFEDARQLMAQGKYADACPKFADSQRLDPAAGTLLNLANCYDKNGQTASAWATFKDAAAESKKAGHPDWEERARKRAAALEPSLSRLTLHVPNAVESLQLTRDGVAVARAEWELALPVDPGTHVIEATAPRTHKWSTSVSVGPSAARATVTIPTLEAEKAETPAAPPPSVEPPPAGGRATSPDDRAAGSTQRIVGIVVGAAGVVGIGVGSAFGVVAKSKNDEALQPNNCRTSNFCSAQGLALTDDAKSAATLSTVFFSAGAALLVAGGVIFFTAPHAARGKAPSSAAVQAVRFAPLVGRETLGMGVGGAF
jgi:hypothetical protein